MENRRETLRDRRWQRRRNQLLTLAGISTIGVPVVRGIVEWVGALL